MGHQVREANERPQKDAYDGEPTTADLELEKEAQPHDHYGNKPDDPWQHVWTHFVMPNTTLCGRRVVGTLRQSAVVPAGLQQHNSSRSILNATFTTGGDGWSSFHIPCE